MNPGGKGANQAVAAARAGGDVVFVCKVGDDIFGSQSIQHFKESGIDTSYVMVDPVLPSGVALITVDKHGENSIVVASGANSALKPADVELAKKSLLDASIIVTQLETPIETVVHLADLAGSMKKVLILNPAPAASLPDGLLAKVTVLTPNKHEAALLTGLEVNNLSDASQAAAALTKKGVRTVAVTMGSEGVLLRHDGTEHHIPAVKVKAVDSTAAGDVFNGALAVALSEQRSMIDAVKFACQAAAISVTRKGAQASAPYRNEI